MQVLISTATLAGTTPIYLPYGRAPVPFGDPLAASLTAATPTVVTVPGYIPTTGDAVSFSVAGTSGFLSSLAGLTSISLQLNTVYYVVGTSISGNTFDITTTVGGVAPATLQASITTLMQKGGQLFVHLLSSQSDGTLCPFETGATALAMNLGNTATLTTIMTQSVTILGAADLNTVLSTGAYGAPLGPNAAGTTGWSVIGTIGFGAPKLVNLNYDWIVATGSTGTLVLIQN